MNIAFRLIERVKDLIGKPLTVEHKPIGTITSVTETEAGIIATGEITDPKWLEYLQGDHYMAYGMFTPSEKTTVVVDPTLPKALRDENGDLIYHDWIKRR